MDRRAVLPARAARAQQKDFSPRPGTWRTFETTARVEVLKYTITTREIRA
jgi:hypothetical protein